MSERVRIYEVGPRDGLQNEKALIATADKIRLIDMLSDCGFARIEATSFVSPRWIPQLADAAEVMAGIRRGAGTLYGVLVPNLRGFDLALQSRADEVAVFTAASEGFCRKNINCSVAESMDRFAPVMEAAQAAGVTVRGYVSCVIDCPYDGAIPPQAVADLAQRMVGMGCREISLGDTIGTGTPDRVAAMLNAVLSSVPAAHLAGHFHDTGGNAVANVGVALDMGLRSFDSAVGGLGGCPYAPGAKGNLATSALLDLLDARGFATGIDRGKLAAAERFVASLLTHDSEIPR